MTYTLIDLEEFLTKAMYQSQIVRHRCIVYLPSKVNHTVAEEMSPANVLALLEDPCVRRILTATSDQFMSATALTEHCTASRATVYRRLERLKEQGLINEKTEIDEEGHHRQVYSTAFRRLSVELVDGDLRIELEEDPADRMVQFWEGL